MSKHEHDDQQDYPPIQTRGGTSDGIVGNGEPITGQSGPQDQEEATDFWEELGAAALGKDSDEVHEPGVDEDERR